MTKIPREQDNDYTNEAADGRRKFIRQKTFCMTDDLAPVEYYNSLALRTSRR